MHLRLVRGIIYAALLLIAATTLDAQVLRHLPGRLKVRMQPYLTPAEQQRAIERAGLTIQARILPYAESITAVRDRGEHISIQNVESVLRIEEQLLRSYVVSFENDSIPPMKMTSLLKMGCGDFEIVEPVTLGEIMGIPNDPLLIMQPLLNTIHAYEAWDIEAGDSTVVIGISDTGVLPVHEDLKDALFINTAEIPDNGLDDDSNGYIDDHHGYNFCTKDDGSQPGDTYNTREGHGTGVAGLAAARVNNAVGIAGVGNKCMIFPLKTMPNYLSGIVYGYESIIYCAVNNVDIVNCSWGSESRSCIDSTVVAYAVERDVAVVGAAGNHGTSASLYPASYPKTLSVGVVDPQDSVIKMSAFGPYVDLMAPGHESLTTANDSLYTVFCCTSGSAPLAAGVVGLVRSKYPALKGFEANALVREAIDESPWTFIPPTTQPLLLPRGRLNALKALTLSPDSIPSLEFSDPTISSTSFDTRWGVGDTINIEVHATNVLAPWHIDRIEGLAVVSLNPPIGISLVGDTVLTVDKDVLKGDEVRVTLKCRVDLDVDTIAYVIGTIVGRTIAGDEVRRPLKVSVSPAPAFRDLSNDVLSLSVGDKLRIGNTDLVNGLGSGLRYKEWCGQLYEGGMMITANGRVVDAVRSDRGINDHFIPTKRFISPQPLVGVAQDGGAPDSLRLGVAVEQHVRIASADSGLYVTDITITNISADTLRDFSAGWFYDWDVGAQPASNKVTLDLSGRQFAIEAVSTTNPGEPYVLCAVDCEHPDAVSVSAGINNTVTYYGVPMRWKRDWLLSQKVEQYNGVNDVAVVSGVRFMHNVPPGERRTFRHVIAIDLDIDRARNMILGQITSVNEPDRDVVVAPHPNPASDVVTLDLDDKLSGHVSVSLCDVHGRVVAFLSNADVSTEHSVQIDVSHLTQGIYIVHVVAGERHINSVVNVVR